MNAETKLQFKDLPKEYSALCHHFLPRPIHDKVDYSHVAEVADAMALWQDNFTDDQRDYFDLLCTLMEEYDAEHVKWPTVGRRQILRHLLEARGQSPADLSRLLGSSRNLGAMILRGERSLTIAHIRKLSSYFKVSPELFI